MRSFNDVTILGLLMKQDSCCKKYGPYHMAIEIYKQINLKNQFPFFRWDKKLKKFFDLQIEKKLKEDIENLDFKH
jgi:hypothetical protein